jgi:hypothetical protein
MRYTCAVWVRFFSLLDKKPFLLSDPIQELDLSPLSAPCRTKLRSIKSSFAHLGIAIGQM